MKKEINSFQDLDAWKRSHIFLLDIYKLTKSFPKEELYGLTSQIRRAAVSITNNIAEGFSRYHYKEKSNFYYNARGSVSEVQNLLIIAKDLGYINSSEWSKISIVGDDIKKLINGLIRSVDRQINR